MFAFSRRLASKAITIGLFATVVGVSVVTVLPKQSPWWLLHYVAAAWLVFSIAFHYAATLCRDPGLLTFRYCADVRNRVTSLSQQHD